MKLFPILTIISLWLFNLNILACPPDGDNETFTDPPQLNLEDIPSIQNSNTDSGTKAKDTNQINLPGTHVLVLGGGYSASGNQVSLESNVKYFRKIRQKIHLQDAQEETYFADGNDSARDLQYFDPSYTVPLINQVLAEVFGNPNTVTHQYRTNNLNPNGSSSLQSVDRWLSNRKKSITPDNNLIYFTGHGGKGTTKTPHNTKAFLWSNESLKVSDFVQKLDQLPANQSTFLIMVQCYSGGFANVIFEDGDPGKRFTDRSRAGFFSTIQSRVAAGCTPDIREENYSEYSTSFWEALSGVTRMGKEIKKPDYDKDGKTSLMEAHSYVCIHSETIDIPLKTSDVLLRKYMGPKTNTTPKKKEDKNILEKLLTKLDNNYSKSTPTEKNLEDFTKTDYLDWASSEEKAIFNALSLVLELHSNFPGKDIKALQEELKKEKDRLQKEKKVSLDQKNKYRDELRKRLKKKYPELVNPYHERVSQIIQTKEKDVVLSIINNQSTWDQLLEAKRKSNQLESEKFQIEKKEAKVLRLRRCMENIFLTQKLKEKGTVEQNSNFQKLQSLERCDPQLQWKMKKN